MATSTIHEQIAASYLRHIMADAEAERRRMSRGKRWTYIRPDKTEVSGLTEAQARDILHVCSGWIEKR